MPRKQTCFACGEPTVCCEHPTQDTFQIRCYRCGARGPRRDTIHGAAAAVCAIKDDMAFAAKAKKTGDGVPIYLGMTVWHKIRGSGRIVSFEVYTIDRHHCEDHDGFCVMHRDCYSSREALEAAS